MNLFEQVKRLLSGDGAPTDPSRRRFLRAALVGSALAATVDVEQLLWTPGEKTIFLPDADDEWIPNYLVTDDWIVREGLRILENNLTILKSVNRAYDDRFLDARTVGEAVNIIVPMRWDMSDVDHLKPGRRVTMSLERFL